MAETLADTIISRSGENGSSQRPARPAVSAKPTIIITHTSVAAEARRSACTRVASNTSNDVPLALTPRPTRMKLNAVKSSPATGAVAIHAVPTAAPKPPSASTAMPPAIHGVRRLPWSEPKPMRGRAICTA